MNIYGLFLKMSEEYVYEIMAVEGRTNHTVAQNI